jgi:hypothetical protein
MSDLSALMKPHSAPLLVLLAACSEAPDAPTADRAFINGAVYTVDAERSWAAARANTVYERTQ